MLLEIFKKINIEFSNDLWGLNLLQEGVPLEMPDVGKEDNDNLEEKNDLEEENNEEKQEVEKI